MREDNMRGPDIIKGSNPEETFRKAIRREIERILKEGKSKRLSS